MILHMLLLSLTTLWAVTSAVYVPPAPKYRCPEEAYIYPCKCTKESDNGIEVFCVNSNLASIALGLSNIHNTLIEKLTLSRCHIRRLYGNVFQPLPVRVLRIEETPIQQIEQETFLGMNYTLQELYIYNTQLTEVPVDALSSLQGLTVLHIKGSEISTIPASAFNQLGKLKTLVVSNSRLSSLHKNAFSGLRKLVRLELYGNALSDISRGTFSSLRDVEFLDLARNNFTALNPVFFGDLSKMLWCNMSHNAVTDFKRGVFARNTLLRVLHMNNNLIQRLDANSFRGMRLIRRLYFSDNNISDIGRGTFATVRQIGTIDLSRNKLSTVDYQMFNELGQAEEINLAENNITTIKESGFVGLSYVYINLSHNALDVVPKNSFTTCINITTLDLSHNNISNFSRIAFDDVSYAVNLYLQHNRLVSMSDIPLKNMTGLQMINVSYNELEKIPRNSIPKLYELHTVDASHNRIHDIGPAVFQSLFSVRSIDLSHNALHTLSPGTVGTIPTLLELNMSFNNLSRVSPGAFANLVSLRTLYLQNNSLSVLFKLPISLNHLHLSHNFLAELPASKPWPIMNSLIYLDLSHNQLTNEGMERGSFKNLLTLRHINLEANAISEVPWEALSDLTGLQNLNLNHNFLTNLSRNAFGHLPVVFDLQLAHNQLNNISEKAFEGLLQLVSLNMSFNNFSSIRNGAFYGLVSLRTLDLSHNHLHNLDNKTHSLLEDCLSLERVNLSHNEISYLSKRSFPSNPYIPYKLKEIDLSYNEIPVVDREFNIGTSKVEILNLSHNILNEIRAGILGNMTQLRILDLSYNELTDLDEEPTSFGPPQNLTHFYVQHNKLRRLPEKQLIDLFPRLRVVDVSSNLVTHFTPKFMKLIENGTMFHMRENPLKCDCTLRPLLHYLAAQVDSHHPWDEITCHSPAFLTNHAVDTLNEEAVTCSTDDDEIYQITPDVKIRYFERPSAGSVQLSWYVTTLEDVANFRVIVKPNERDSLNPLVDKQISYGVRRVDALNLPASNSDLLLCILARDSLGNVRKGQPSQCRTVKGPTASSESVRTNPSVHLYIVSLIILLTSAHHCV